MGRRPSWCRERLPSIWKGSGPRWICSLGSAASLAN